MHFKKIFEYGITTSILFFVLYLMQASRYIFESSKLALAVVLFLGIQVLFVYLKNLDIVKITMVAFLTYLCWAFYASVTPYSDFNTFFNLSGAFTNRLDLKILFDSKSPTTTLYYSLFIYLFGKTNITPYLASGLMWSLQIPVLYKALQFLKIEDKKACFIAAMYGFYPGIVFYSTVVSSETLFMFFIIYSFYLVLKSKNDSFDFKYAGITGFVFGLFFLTRSNAIAFIIPYTLYIFISQKRSKLFSFLFTLALFIPLSGQMFLNNKYADNLSISASPWTEYSLMVGSNQKTNGGSNTDDVALAGYQGKNKVSHKEASKNALEIAKSRVMKDPIDFIKFAFTDKIQRLWERDGQNIMWGIIESEKKESLTDETQIGIKTIEGAFFLMILSSIAFLLLQFISRIFGKKEAEGREQDLLFLTVIPLILLASMHIFVEVQPRYHMPFLPFLIIFSGLFILNIDKYKDWLIGKCKKILNL